MMDQIRIGLLGLGTVGTGVVKTIRLQEEKLSERLGKKVQIVKILVKDVLKPRPVEVNPGLLTTDFADVLKEKPDVIIEVMGGLQPAFQYINQAIEKGCHVVTANKELLAKWGDKLIRTANQHQVHLFYEASVAGGIPVISVLRHFLRTNDISEIKGILNGTTNYILTQMEQHGKSYDDVLKEAQQLGYAETDPTSDVEGFDALYKATILSQLLFGKAPAVDEASREGISRITIEEIGLAKALGYRFKLIAQVKGEKDGVQVSVRPSLLPFSHSLAQIEDAFNAVQLTGNIVGDLLFTGIGAGEFPTASAVVEDLAYLLSQPVLAQPEWSIAEGKKADPAFKRAYFVYWDQNKSPLAFHDLLHQLEEANCKILTQIGQESEKMGLVVEGDFRIEQLAHVGVYPILGTINAEITADENIPLVI
ncbi:homoserine dehydrogenase [Ammoniphilus sp. 3BR4]|uniref:homoserine dehydrogenase n=1 Tax=Ammoniphilus sp. 3BR4 TaxID=3158265 RepID=UPI0034669B04